MDNLNNLYIPVRERIFALLESKSIQQKYFAKTIEVSVSTITDWKKGKSFSFMKKLTPIAEVLGTSDVWLLTGKNDAQADEIVQSLLEEAHPMNAKFEIDPSLLDAAVEVMRFAADRCEADAAALARLDTPEAREVAQERLQMAKTADELLLFFAEL